MLSATFFFSKQDRERQIERNLPISTRAARTVNAHRALSPLTLGTIASKFAHLAWVALFFVFFGN